MIIIDKPYISTELKNYLDKSQIPVLKTDISVEENKNHCFNLMEEKDFVGTYNEESRLFSLSENSLDWVKENIDDKALLHSINIMKDKSLFREQIKNLYPEFFFKKININEFENLDLGSLPYPLILKPAVGFFSAGVYSLTSEKDFRKAIGDIKETFGKWKEVFPSSVVGESEFILEEYINGDEYAIDAYFDEKGNTVVLNILEHEFKSETDVGDRLYYTSKEILENNVEKFENYLKSINNILNLKNFPFHVELRVDKKGNIAPIEFNPLRFAGWSTTDITYMAFGFYTYDYYFNNIKPDWNSLLKGKDNKKYTIIVLDKPASYTSKQTFDFEKLKKDFTKVLAVRELDYKNTENPFCFLFTETPYENLEELSKIAASDLTEYLF